jgi:outer membrane immunogenic protein
MSKMLLASTALLVLVSGSAMAADLSRPAPAPAPVYTKAPMMAPAFSWTGCYLGGHGGGAWADASHTFDNGAGTVESFSFNPSSYIAGGQLGCQLQMNTFVFGVEGTWSATDLKQTDISVLLPLRQRMLKIDELATVTGRLGVAFDRVLLYGKGGWVDARVETFAINPATGVNGDLTAWQGGWTVGGGVDWAVWQNVVLGAEFNYYKLKYDRTIPASDGTIGTISASNANIYSAVARLSYLFNFGR